MFSIESPSSSVLSLTDLTVPKTRKPKFDFTLKIIDLNNVPLTHGQSYVKWHLPASASAEHRGRTNKVDIKEHRATWDYNKNLPVRLTVDRTSMLQYSEVHLEVVQEYATGARGNDRIILGNVKLNLAEYADVDEGQDPDGIIERRYLMQDSKVNSTLKVGIGMRLVEGERNFVAPPLKTAMVFGGIAGIMSGEAGDPEDIGHLPSLNTKTREMGELQDMYRRTLVASWAIPSGELPPDEVVEDIFAGGNGGMMPPPGRPTASTNHYHHTYNYHHASQQRSRSAFEDSDAESSPAPVGRAGNGRLSPSSVRKTPQRDQSMSSSHRRSSHTRTHSRNSSGGESRNTEGGYSSNALGNTGGGNGSISGRGSIEHELSHSSQEHLKRRGAKKILSGREITEFDMREDLRSWKIGGVD